MEDAEVESIVADLCGRHRSWIPHAVCELSLRLGRCHDLKDEVDSIRTSLKVRSRFAESVVTRFRMVTFDSFKASLTDEIIRRLFESCVATCRA